jgi:alpha-galactosidase
MPLTVTDQGGTIVLANDFLTFTFSLRHGRFSLRPAGAPDGLPALVNATALAVYRSGLRTITARMDERGSIVYKEARGQDIHGPGHHALFYWTDDVARLGLTVVVYDNLPFVLVRLLFTHRSAGPLAIERLAPVQADPAAGGGLSFAVPPARLALFRNGWSSWSPALRAGPGDPPPDGQFVKHARAAFLNAETPAGSKNEFWSESFTAIGPPADPAGGPRTGLVAGFVSLADQFSAIGLTLASEGRGGEPPQHPLQMVCQADQVQLPADTSLGSEWAYLQWLDLRQDDVFGDYACATARQMDARVPVRGPVGWSTWSTAGPEPSADRLGQALGRLIRTESVLPVEVLQLDAGYAPLPGDWRQMDSARFPRGLAALAEQIRASGRIPGLWLAPFVVHPDSVLAADHGDWLLKDGSGRPVNAGQLDGTSIYALDTSHPEVGEWLAKLIRTVRREWGFAYLKLDFLYAAALPGKRRDPQLTRAQALRRALWQIREAAGADTFLAAAGCPLGPAVGLVNAMRIGPDGAPAWVTRAGRWGALFKGGPAAPGARNAIRNTLTRSPLHRRWWLNDPDALSVRGPEAGESLSAAEARSLVSAVGLAGGLRVFGDDLVDLDPGRRALLAAVLPELADGATACDLLESEAPSRYALRLVRPWGAWTVLGIFNWEDDARDITVRLSEAGIEGGRPLHVYDFWSRQYHRLTAAELLLPQVPGHGCHVLGIRAMAAGPHLVASSFHISQGGEISEWTGGPDRLRFTLTLGRRAEGEVLLWSARPPGGARSGGQLVPLVDLGGGVSALHLAVDRAASVEVQFA